MAGTTALTMSPLSERELQLEIERCEQEIAAIEDALADGHADVGGLCLALSDWVAELGSAERATPPGISRRRVGVRGLSC
jgi:hypothetical protein